MKRSISALKREISRAPTGKLGRCRYSKKLREQIVQATRAALSDGENLRQIAKDLGLRDQLLGKWVRAPAKRNPVRSVEVVDDKPRDGGTLRLRLPGGAVVEGLSLEDVSDLIRQAP